MSHSETLFAQAKQLIPGGVNSPVRAFGSVGGTPRFIQSAQGATITDVDGQTYIDYVGSWGPMILGHNDPDIREAVTNAATHGLSFGAPCEQEVILAQMLCALMPSVDKVRMVNSGTEATMTALRLARGFTGKNKIIKFEGCYHGHADHLLVKAGSGALTFGIPTSPGIPRGAAEETLTATFNQLDTVAALFENYPDDIAAIIVEPVAGNMNMVLPVAGFLEGLRSLCDQYNTLLIFDEVMTGFRIHPQGAQGLYGIIPDLSTFGKIIGGGMPVGALGGRQDIMDSLAPIGPVYQAGTLSGNPLAMSAGIATLKKLARPNFYPELEANTRTLVNGIVERMHAANISFTANTLCGMFGLFFNEAETVTQYDQVMNSNKTRFNNFFHFMLDHSIYFAPSAFEAGFVSSQHTANTHKTTWAAIDTWLEKST